MPFPLHALDYGSRCRLRKLVSPAEAYVFQTAAPHVDGFQPIQKVQPLPIYSRVLINENDELEAIEHPSNPLSFDKLYVVEGSFRIENFTSKHGGQLITDRFVMVPEEVTFDSCELTAKFLQNIFTKVKNDIVDLTFCDCTFHNDVTLDLVCTLFKKLEVFSFNNSFLTPDWIATLILHDYTGMKNITVVDAALDLLQVEETQLINFMKAQSEGFSIHIALEDNCDDLKVLQLLDKQFSNNIWRLEETYSIGSYIVVAWKSSEEYRKRFYYMVS